jgi:hypothetical protein
MVALRSRVVDHERNSSIRDVDHERYSTIRESVVELVGNDDHISNVNFGNFQLISIGGLKFNDVNGNGVHDVFTPFQFAMLNDFFKFRPTSRLLVTMHDTKSNRILRFCR